MEVFTGIGSSPLTQFVDCLHEQQSRLSDTADRRSGGDWLTLAEVCRDISENGDHGSKFQAAYHESPKAPADKLTAAFDAHRALLKQAWIYSQGDCTKLDFGLALSPAMQAVSDLLPYLTPPQQSKKSGPGDVGEKKKRTRPGMTPELIRGALNAIHGYNNGEVQRFDPAIPKEIASKAGVSEASITNFWAKKLGGRKRRGTYDDYLAACRNRSLGGLLMLLNGDIASEDVKEAVEGEIRRARNLDD